jgi:hypothetical protein
MQRLSPPSCTTIVFSKARLCTHRKSITAKYLAAAGHTLGNAEFAYVGEWHRENSAILEFQTVIDGIAINGIDMISCDDDGLITHFKVMVRPLKAMNMLHQKMGEMLQRMSA